MPVSLIVAIARNRVIGRDGALPWHLPDELKYFRRITLGKPVVMGRRTYESIGKPLGGRHNIVVTRNPEFRAEGCSVATSLDDAIAIARGAATPEIEVMILGGADIFAAALPLATRLYLTEVDADIAGDVFFPDHDATAWRELSRDHHAADERHAHAFDLVVLER
ncbi:MAG: dihydrofolate reductase [Gammaproteobacteria bacterium]|nr:dihydrofolate reductase [Gammaproteobacteria bacterium]